ncbi:hypothetical protein PBI_ZOEJ_64 [Mycobacterium phage ZoeJ]|uniref:Uncharacterized protein n=1 Tax=Mycobacterium phage ZoeJ TaxID=1486427 RepID=A0A023W756_9CAUD|nr:hypothetical protein PBI_ZOEJ_64 [Mycobacterium phage ZoeJ]AHY26888.1 hypothetical protein PBI_ZOEJ_64 [Mycobacterium phage ZoeJ]
MEQNETQWWRPINDSCLITIEHAVVSLTAVIYYVEVHNRAGEKHRFQANGLYWSARDIRVQRDEAPAVGEWERVPAPGEAVEFDLGELGKLLDDGKPPADNGEGVL